MKRLLYLMILVLLGGTIIFLPACSDDESELESDKLVDETDDESKLESDELVDETDNSGDDDSVVEMSYDVSGTLNGYGYVDLGLSVVWATCNIGADCPIRYGGYYAWGRLSEKCPKDYPHRPWKALRAGLAPAKIDFSDSLGGR